MPVMIDVAVKTIDRGPKRNYLGETLSNLTRSGVFKSPNLGQMTLVDQSLDSAAFMRSQKAEHLTVDNSASRTMHQNAQRCIELVGSGSAEWGLVIEDDIDTCDWFLESVADWLEDHEVEGPMMYVFGANYAQIRHAVKLGRTAWTYPCSAFYGALACAWRREVAKELAAWLGPDPGYINKDGGKIRNRGHDLMLGRWGHAMKLKHFLASCPCFIQHIGLESGLDNKKIQYAGFAGRDWRYRRPL